MKSFIIAILVLLDAAAFGQVGQRLTVYQNTIVRDSAGMTYPYVVWQKLVQGGDYNLRPVSHEGATPEFYLVKLTEEEKLYRLSRMRKPPESQFFTTGAPIKPFKIKDIDGKKVETKDWAGKTVVINFWFIGCPPCRAEIPELNRLALRYKNNPNVIFLAIALDQSWDIKDFVKKTPFAYQLVGDGSYFAGMFGIHLFPTNVVVDKDGKVQFHSSGYALNTPFWIEKTLLASDGQGNKL